METRSELKKALLNAREKYNAAQREVDRLQTALQRSASRRPHKTRDRILRALAKANGKGVTVASLSHRLRMPTANVHSFFSKSLPRVGEIEKVGRSTYRLTISRRQ